MDPAKRKARKDRAYALLREQNFTEYTRCVETATAIALNHSLELPAAAAIEYALVCHAITLLELES